MLDSSMGTHRETTRRFENPLRHSGRIVVTYFDTRRKMNSERCVWSFLNLDSTFLVWCWMPRRRVKRRREIRNMVGSEVLGKGLGHLHWVDLLS